MKIGFFPSGKPAQQVFETRLQPLVGFLAALLFCPILVMTPVQVQAQDQGDDTQNLIRSAMIYNFCKFVQWPESTPGDSIVLGVIGNQLTPKDFLSIKGKAVREAPITIRVVQTPEELQECQLVFIGSDQSEGFASTLSVTQKKSILTISDIDGFCEEGGIIQLVERRGKLRFFINRNAANQARLSMSSQLLKVARIVEGD